MIIYFSGTGNSRYIAELLAKGLDDSLIDAAEYIKAGRRAKLLSEKPYVFVSPVYAWRLPRVFEKWIRESDFEGSKRAYFALTCGSGIGGAEKYIKKLTEEKGFLHMGAAEVVMPENYIAVFSAPSEKRALRIIEGAEELALTLMEQISLGKPFDKVGISPLGHILSGIVNRRFYKYTVGAKKFYVKESCISCGKCADNCMLNNITIVDGKPRWGDDCTHCMACICKCPSEAIEYGRHSVGLRRYTCPKGKE